MRRRKKAIMVMAAIAAFFAKTTLSEANKQMPPEVRHNPTVVNVEKEMMEHAQKGDLKQVRKDAKKLKKTVKQCSDDRCTIKVDDSRMPEFVSSGDLDRMYDLAGKFHDGKMTADEFSSEIRGFKKKYGHDIDALIEARGFETMLKEKKG